MATEGVLTQYKINVSNIWPQEILDHYAVLEADLHRVFDQTTSYVESKGIPVQIVDLSQVSDSWEEDTDHAETCTSDGKTLFLHNQLSDHGGILTRFYDLLHLGCGHVIQRWADERSWLTRYGDKAYTIWSVFHGWANQQVLKDVEDYEFEAGKMWLAYLNNIILPSLSLNTPTENIMKLYSDYVRNDKRYIIEYYRTQVSKNFFSEREFDQDPVDISGIKTPVPFIPIKRGQIQIGLIRSDK